MYTNLHNEKELNKAAAKINDVYKRRLQGGVTSLYNVASTPLGLK